MKKFIIVNKNSFFVNKFKNTKYTRFIHIQKKKDLNFKKIKKINPEIIFIPHWSFKIDEKIYKKYNCIGFHSTPLPFGRGGSPIHNMVLKKFKKTQICAFKITDKIDSGPIYVRQNLSLHGNGYEIFLRMYNKIILLISKMIIKLPKPKKQKGRPTNFKRLQKNSEIKSIYNLNYIYNLIRVLDMRDNSYENAFLKYKNLKISFTNAEMKNNEIYVKSKIKIIY